MHVKFKSCTVHANDAYTVKYAAVQSQLSSCMTVRLVPINVDAHFYC